MTPRDINITREGILNIQVCCPKQITAQEAQDWLHDNSPAGTTWGWIFEEKLGVVVCANDPERVHYVFTC